MMQVTPLNVTFHRSETPVQRWLGRETINGRDYWGLVLVHDAQTPEATKFAHFAQYDTEVVSPTKIMAAMEDDYQWTQSYPPFTFGTGTIISPAAEGMDLKDAFIELGLVPAP